MSRRWSTVHDAAALRLHPSGERVPLVSEGVRNPTKSAITAKNKNPTFARRGSRGHWIATDAGGNGRVTKRRKVGEAKEGNGEKERSVPAGADEQDAGLSLADDAPAKTYKDSRANRRVAFKNDFTFLSDLPQTDSPRPSSDFLKCIHHLASEHYASRGQLFDSAANYRKEKKERRERRMLQAQASESKGAESSDENAEGSDEDEKEGDDFAGEDMSLSKSNLENKNKVQTRLKSTQRDMYKAFDGSALLCIGMLLQSHISSMLADPDGCIPDGWEDDALSTNGEGDDKVVTIPEVKKKGKVAKDKGGHKKRQKGRSTSENGEDQSHGN